VNPQSLDRRSLAGELDGLLRLDRQLVSVGERAAAELSLRGVETAPRWLLFGTGAAGLFVNRFSFLHPGRVAIAVAEIPGGWPLTPVEAANLDGLGYPVSTADLDAFVAEPVTAPELRSVRHALFTFADTAGSLREAVSAEVAGEVRERFGATLSERWAYAELAYAGFGIRSSFELLDAAPAERGRHAEHPAGDRILGMALSVFRDVEDD
jgi:hypothetical protein